MSVRIRRLSEEIDNKRVVMNFIEGSEQVADIMTKALGKVLHLKFVSSMGLVNLKMDNLVSDRDSKLRGNVGGNK